MDIYSLSNKMHEESEMLQVLGLENVGFRFTMDGDEYASCTCGCFKRINKKYGREHIVDYTRIREGDKIVARCEKCGNPYFYDIDYNEEDISSPIKFQPTVVLDTEEYFVIKIIVYAVRSVLNELTLECDNEFYFVYDKANDNLFVAEDNGNGDIEVEEDGYKAHIEKCKLCDIFSWNDCFVDVNFDAEFYSLVGFEEIVKLVGEKTGQMLDSDDTALELSYILGSLALNAKIKYLPHLKEEIKNGKPLRKFLLHRFYGIDEICSKFALLERCGVDYSKSTLEEAFGVDIDFLATCDGYEGFKKIAPFNKLVIKENLQAYIIENADYLTDKQKELICQLYAVAQANEQVDNFETFIKHIIRAANNGVKVNDILIVLEKVLDNIDDYLGLIDFTKPFTKSILTKKSFVDNNILTLEEYDKFLQKPTVDTMYKLLQQH